MLSVMEWISVKDKMPHDDWIEQFGDAEHIFGSYIVYFGGDKDDPDWGVCDYSVEFGWTYHGTFECNPHADKITHWSLPDPPKGE